MSRGKFCFKERKIKFPSKEAAQPRIDAVYAATSLRLYPYFCVSCKSIHLSKHAVPKGYRVKPFIKRK